jgi:hypothetical protein
MYETALLKNVEGRSYKCFSKRGTKGSRLKEGTEITDNMDPLKMGAT